MPLHVPHEATVRAWPQLSVPIDGPQLLLMRAQNCGSLSPVQAQRLPLQVSGLAHVPQLTDRAAPQLSGPVSGPQVAELRWQKAAFDSG